MPLYLPFIKEVFIQASLPLDLIFLPLIESAFSPKAYSRAGASGVWQFMPSTARFYHLKIDFWVDERCDPFKSSEKAAALLKDLYKFYGNWELSLAAYNAGMGSVNQAIATGKTNDYWKLSSMYLLKRETREYVPRFLAAVHIAKNPISYGFTIDYSQRIPEFEIVNVRKPVDLTILGKKIDVRVNELMALNPELKRIITPIGRDYSLRVPKNKYAAAISAYHALPKDELTGVEWYTVRTGDTISEIAQKYNVNGALIKQINNITNPRRVFAGKKILIPVNLQSNSLEHMENYKPKKGYLTQEIMYTIQRGDTIWDIANRYRTDIKTVLAINGLTFESIIMPGDEIKLWLDIALQP